MANAATRWLLSLSLCALIAGVVQAGPIALGTATLNGAQEVPPVDTASLGAAALSVDETSGLYNFSLLVSGISQADLVDAGPNGTPVHIHSAPAGANGGIVVDVALAGTITDLGGDPATGFALEVSGGTFGGTQGALDAPDPATNIADLLAGNLYVNVHTNDFNGGEIRGQIAPVVVPEPSSLMMLVLALTSLCGLRRRSYSNA